MARKKQEVEVKEQEYNVDEVDTSDLDSWLGGELKAAEKKYQQENLDGEEKKVEDDLSEANKEKIKEEKVSGLEVADDINSDKIINNILPLIDLENIEDINLFDISEEIFRAINEDNMIVDEKTRKTVSVNAEKMIYSVKLLLNSLYRSVNDTLLWRKNAMQVSKAIVRCEEMKQTLRNLEYVINMLMADLMFESQEGETQVNYFVARVEAKEKGQNSYTSKNEILLECLKREEYCKKQYKNQVISKLLNYFKAINSFANQSYFLLSASKQLQDQL